MTEVQSIILNIAFPSTLEDVLEIYNKNENTAVEDIVINAAKYSASEKYKVFSWTVPKWIKPDDIVFFMHSKTSKNTIARLRNELKASMNHFTKDEVAILQESLAHGMEIYEKYGGKIFAVGRVTGNPEYYKSSDFVSYWNSRVYAYVDDIYVLSNPIALAEFKSFITLSCGGTITPIYTNSFDKLKETISRNNDIPRYLADSISVPLPLAGINRNNWLEVSSRYRASFIYESQFRIY